MNICIQKLKQLIRLIALQPIKPSHKTRVQVEHFVSCYRVRCDERVEGFDGTLGRIDVPVVEDRIINMLVTISIKVGDAWNICRKLYH